MEHIYEYGRMDSTVVECCRARSDEHKAFPVVPANECDIATGISIISGTSEGGRALVLGRSPWPTSLISVMFVSLRLISAMDRDRSQSIERAGLK